MPRKKQKIKKSEKINWKILIACFAIVYIVAFIVNAFTIKDPYANPYASAVPSISPPNYAFLIVWGIIFFLIAFSLYLILTKVNEEQKSNVVLVYGVNFLLNVIWNILFFGIKGPLIAFFDVIALLMSVIAMISVSNKIDKNAAYLLIPYLLWICFITILNFMIVI